MDSRASLVLKIVTTVLIVAILGIGVLLVQYLITNAGNVTPRTELERAVVAAEESVRANPENAPARIKLAAAYLENNATNAAREQAKIAVRLAPKDPSGYYILGLVEAKAKDDKAAVVQFKKAATTEGQLAGFYLDVYRAMAGAYSRSGETSEAIGAMNKAIEFGPEETELLVFRGQLYEKDKKWADALFDYVSAMQYVPDYQEAVTAAKRVAKEHPEAVKEMQKRFDEKLPANVSGAHDTTGSTESSTTDQNSDTKSDKK
ncbi:MAG TPA: tetratricopeptide repeat protein [Coriobacteriia bacterium]|nr:tetratricopeptide repeat protein [Coriobacteriia bacterium]